MIDRKRTGGRAHAGHLPTLNPQAGAAGRRLGVAEADFVPSGCICGVCPMVRPLPGCKHCGGSGRVPFESDEYLPGTAACCCTCSRCRARAERYTRVVGVLAVVAWNDPGGLLAGSHGGKPPRCYLGDVGWTTQRPLFSPANASALPLWWGGAPVAAGWSRAREEALDRPDARGLWSALDAWAPRAKPDVLDAMGLARELVENRIVERIALVDAERIEVAP